MKWRKQQRRRRKRAKENTPTITTNQPNYKCPENIINIKILLYRLEFD